MEPDQNSEEQPIDEQVESGQEPEAKPPEPYTLDHEEFTVIAFNPKTNGIPFAIRYAHIREGDVFTDNIAGWYYGSLGKKQFFESYFCLKLNSSGRIQNFYDSNGCHINEGFQMDMIDINNPRLKTPMITNPELSADMATLAGKFLEDWFVFSEYLERGNLETFESPRINKARLEMMSREGDVLVYWSPNGPDPDLLAEMSLYWPLKTRFRSI